MIEVLGLLGWLYAWFLPAKEDAENKRRIGLI